MFEHLSANNSIEDPVGERQPFADSAHVGDIGADRSGVLSRFSHRRDRPVDTHQAEPTGRQRLGEEPAPAPHIEDRELAAAEFGGDGGGDVRDANRIQQRSHALEKAIRVPPGTERSVVDLLGRAGGFEIPQ